jgi:hypothetical protein
MPDDLDAAGLRLVILYSHRHGQGYRDLPSSKCRQAFRVTSRSCAGQRVTYWGRSNDQHTEWFLGEGHNK